VGVSALTSSSAILAATVPGTPTSLSVKTQDKYHIQLQWNDPVDIGGTTLDSYVIEMDSGTSVTPGVFRIMQIQANTATDTFYTLTYLNSAGAYVNVKAGDIY
jgi:hypothetical protein